MAKKSKKIDYFYSVGRRKSASARARVFRGKGESSVNGLEVAKYFPGEVLKSVYLKPFRVLDVSDKFYFTVKVVGGGKRGQADAVAHSLAKALNKADKSFRTELKKAGLLTRDQRTRERRKVGTGGKARRKKQSPKR